MPTTIVTISDGSGELEFNVDYEVHFGTPARLSGPPEDCDPGEDDEILVESVEPTPDFSPAYHEMWKHVTTLSKRLKKEGNIALAKELMAPLEAMKERVDAYIQENMVEQLVRDRKDSIAEDAYEARREQFEE